MLTRKLIRERAKECLPKLKEEKEEESVNRRIEYKVSTLAHMHDLTAISKGVEDFKAGCLVRVNFPLWG